MQEFLKEMISIRLRKGKQQSIDRKHPWVFSGALHLNNVACEDGELVGFDDCLGGVDDFLVAVEFGDNFALDFDWWEWDFEVAQ